MRRFVVVIVAALLPAPVLAADVEPVVQAKDVLSRFDGFYAAFGGSFGLSEDRTFSTSSFYGNSGAGGNGRVAVQGPSGVAIAGYNLAFSSALVGLELDGRFGSEGGSESMRAPGAFSGSSVHRYKFDSDIGVHIAARAGLMRGDTLIYAKLGVGVVRMVDRFDLDDSRALFSPICCPSPAAPLVAGQRLSLSAETWAPSVLLGMGLEQDYGRFFARAGAEVEGIHGRMLVLTNQNGSVPPSFQGFASGTSDAWVARATALVGLRF
jgi:hypothetical protein